MTYPCLLTADVVYFRIEKDSFSVLSPKIHIEVSRMKRNSLTALVLSLVLCLGFLLPVHAQESENQAFFPDVEGHWARDILERWHGYGVIAGDTVTGAFRPDDPLTRAEFAALLNRIMGYPLVEVKHFNDVPANAWYAEIMSRLNSAGIIQGDGDDMVRPLDPVTKQEAAVILCRVLNLKDEEANVDFLDKDEISLWAAGAVGALYNMGAIHGYEGYFDPQEPINRAQAVALLDNLFDAVMTRPGTWNQNVEGDLYVNAKWVRLEDMTVSGDLIITAGVGSGDVTMTNVTVMGDVILRGCGEKSFHILSGCDLQGDILIHKPTNGAIRLVNESESADLSVQVTGGSSTVILEGDIASVKVNAATPVSCRNGKIETLSISAPNADLTVEKGCAVSSLSLESSSTDAELSVKGSVTDLTVNTAAHIYTEGTISSAHITASGVVLVGTVPKKVSMPSGISSPKDGEGKAISNITVIK